MVCLTREVDYIRKNQLIELAEYKDIVSRLGKYLETYKTEEIISKFIDICSENKKHVDFQRQFYDIILNCKDPSYHKNGQSTVSETWDLFKSIF